MGVLVLNEGPVKYIDMKNDPVYPRTRPYIALYMHKCRRSCFFQGLKSYFKGKYLEGILSPPSFKVRLERTIRNKKNPALPLPGLPDSCWQTSWASQALVLESSVS